MDAAEVFKHGQFKKDIWLDYVKKKLKHIGCDLLFQHLFEVWIAGNFWWLYSKWKQLQFEKVNNF